jgi:hypothetical protein
MANRSHSVRSMLAALILVAAFATTAFDYVVDSFKLYTIEGYLDRAPAGATIVARLDIGNGATAHRQLLVTSYRTDADVVSQQDLSAHYLLRGTSEDVTRLLAAPEGSAVNGTFAVYPHAIASLLIASLDRPA